LTALQRLQVSLQFCKLFSIQQLLNLQEGRKTLGELDTEMQAGQDDSSRLETSREYIQQLLDGEQLTESECFAAFLEDMVYRSGI
jgi:hypothetical protein